MPVAVLQTKAMARSHRLGGQHVYSEDANKGKKKPPSLSVYAYQRRRFIPGTNARVFCPGRKTVGAGQSPVQCMPSGLPLSWGERATRKPLLLLRFSGVLLLRFATRQLSALLFQLPPRSTRFEPLRRLTFERQKYVFSECPAVGMRHKSK